MSLRHDLLTEKLTGRRAARIIEGLVEGSAVAHRGASSGGFEASSSNPKLRYFATITKFKLPDSNIDHHPIFSADRRQFISAGEHFFAQVSQDETLAFKPR